MLAGCADVEKAAKNAGCAVTVPFTPGRMDASADQTDVASFAPLEPLADGFRNYVGHDLGMPAEALLGGLRALGANVGQSRHGAFTQRSGALTNDFFVNPARHGHGVEGDPQRRRRV